MSKYKYIFLFAFLAIMTLLTSCSVQFEKRKYTGGYHRTSHYRSPHSSQAERNILTPSPSSQSSTLDQTSNSKLEEVESNPVVSLSTNAPRSKRIRFQEPCDKIIFSDGSKAEVKIIETTSTDIIYRKCNDPSAPLMVLSLKHVSEISYASGEKKEMSPIVSENDDVEKDETRLPPSKKQPVKIDTGWIINILALIFAIVGLMMMIFGFTLSWYWLFGAIVFAALASTLGMIGIFRKGKPLGIIAVVIGTICSIVVGVLFGIL